PTLSSVGTGHLQFLLNSAEPLPVSDAFASLIDVKDKPLPALGNTSGISQIDDDEFGNFADTSVPVPDLVTSNAAHDDFGDFASTPLPASASVISESNEFNNIQANA